jgi:stress-induced morphogen
LDTSGGCGASFQVFIGTDKFEDVALLDRHRMVNDALKEEMSAIHALQIKAWTSTQWEQRKDRIPTE